MAIECPPYQNFIPGVGHKRLPSRFELQQAAERNQPEPQPEVISEEHKRKGNPIRKNGYENFIPGVGHKLMPTWEQIHREEERVRCLEAGVPPPNDDPENRPQNHQCQQCGKIFDSPAALFGHRKAHREV